MRQSLFLTFALLISFCGLSQTKKFTFKAGSSYELPRNAEDLCFFGNKKDGIVNLSIKKNELNILRFDPVTLEKTYENKKELPEVTSNFNGEIPLEFGESHFWIHSDWDKELEKESLYYDKVDVTNGNFIEKNIKMFDASKIAGTLSSNGFFSFKTTGKYRFNTDADGKKLLVSYKLYPKEKNDKKNNDIVGLFVFNDAMKKLWSTEYTIPTTEQVTDIVDYSVDSKGNAYMVTKIFDTEKRYYEDPKSKKPAYHYEVSKFSKDTKSPQVIKIDLGDNYISEAILMENTVHEMIISCTYRKNSKPTGTNGIFVGRIDNQGNIINTNKDGLHPFPLPEIAKFESSKIRRKMEKDDDFEPPVLRIRNVVAGKDGTVFIAMEEFSSEHVTTTNNSYNHWFYYYNDIYCMKIDGEGNMQWFTKIPKKQLGTDEYQTLGFKLVADNNNYYFLYVDNKKNIDLAEDEEPEPHLNGYGGNIFAAKIDNKGNLTREILFNPFAEKMMILPTTFTTLDENKFLGRAMLFGGGFKPILISLE